MTSTYTSNQGIEKPGTGDQSGTWGGTVNTNMDIIDRAISGVGALTLTGSTTTLTTTDGTLTDGMYRVLVLGDGGDLGSDNTLTISPNDQDKAYLVYNNLTANRNAIFTQGTGANATVANGATAWIYADGAGSGAAVRVAMLSTEISDQDGDTKIQVEEGGDDDDTIRFDIAGAEDFTMTANTFTALSGSDIAIASGATITNSGTATGFGADAERAIAGVLETNANFVDQVIFGPSVDGVPWNGAWSKASVYSSLMLATIEDEGSNTEINIWDLTEQSAGAISTTPLATVDLSAAATPTSIAAYMGYLIVGSEDGIAIIDPHSGVWAERTTGWPRTLSTSTVPALAANTVNYVAAGAARKPALDSRTGGPMPTFVVSYSGGSKASSILKDSGVVFDRAGTGNVAGISNGDAYVNLGNILYQVGPIDAIVADSYQHSQVNNSASGPFGLQCDTAFSIHNNTAASADASGLTFHKINLRNVNGQVNDPMNAIVTRAYNSGFYTKDIRGIWLANSKTVDRSYKANTLTENGTVTEAAVASGAELNGYSGFSGSNYFSRAADADWASLANGNVHMSVWFKSSGNSAFETYMSARKASPPARIDIYLENDGTVGFECFGDAAETAAVSTGVFDDGVWHKLDGVQISNTERHVYVDGVLVGSNTTNAGSLTSADMILGIGARGHDAAVPATSSTLSLAHFSATAPTATQVRKAYDAEKGMFVASAECLLQSGSTDAILDVAVDPLSEKVLVTQTDAITVFDGLVVDSKPTVNSGNSEKGKLWGDLRAEQNSANAYVTAPAVDQRQVNEMVRGLANDMPKGVDLSKAKAWIKGNTDGTIASSYNIKANTSGSTGICYLDFGIPFKSAEYISIGGTKDNSSGVDFSISTWAQTTSRISMARTEDSADADGEFYMLFFGELENE
jgi:hypothetical protein